MADTIHAFHYPTRLNSGRGALRIEPDYPAYVAGLIKQVLLTAPGQRAHGPDFGAGLRQMVFAPNGDATASLLQGRIYQKLTEWLGDLISLDEVTSRTDGASWSPLLDPSAQETGADAGEG